MRPGTQPGPSLSKSNRSGKGNHLKRLALCIALACAPTPGAEAKGIFSWPQNVQWQIDSGFDYSSGKYGAAADTSVLSIPVEGGVQLDRIRFEFALPYVEATGPGLLAGDVVIGSGGRTTTRSGAGDLNLGAAFLLNRDGVLPAIEVESIVKVPTAGAGLGTGKTDYALQANIYHNITPDFMLFGSVGYQWLASFSTVQLKSGLTATLGANFKTKDDIGFGASAAFRQEYYAGLGDAATLSPYAFWDFTQNWRLTGYGMFGVGKASPEYGLGFRVIYHQ